MAQKEQSKRELFVRFSATSYLAENLITGDPQEPDEKLAYCYMLAFKGKYYKNFLVFKFPALVYVNGREYLVAEAFKYVPKKGTFVAVVVDENHKYYEIDVI